MKKHLLLSLLIALAVIAFGQKKFGKITGPNKDLLLKQIQAQPDQMTANNGEFIDVKSRDGNTTIGTTWYDAQALNYGNMMQRIWAYDDGTVGAIWIGMGPGSPGVPDRGTGYNYFDGTDWGEADPHVGPDDNSGTPSYAPWGENGEIIAQYRYIAGEGPIMIYKRETKGVGEWEEVELHGPNGISLVWHSMITSGDENEYIHILALTYDAPYMGQGNALLYYRSSDGGDTWEIDGEIIDGLGEDYFLDIGSLSYAWANPMGSTIAFTYGFDEFGGRIFKSDDHGDSWEMIDVFTTPFTNYDHPEESVVFGCGIGTSSVALDSDGMAHVVFARMNKIFVAGSASYYPFTDGLIYWNENMEVLDTTIISSYTLEFLDEGGYLIGWLDESLEIPEGQPNYANALWGFPQISIDAENNLFVATSTITEHNFIEFNYRRIFVNSSFNGGLSWEGQVDVTDDNNFIFSECAFPAMAPVIGDKVHIVFQRDDLPGFHEWLDNHAPVENQMIALSFEKDFFVGVGEELEQTNIKLSEGYPNPAENLINFELKLDSKARVNITLTSIVGQIVRVENFGELQSGAVTLSLDVSELMSGAYFFTAEVDHQKFSRKIIVAR